LEREKRERERERRGKEVRLDSPSNNNPSTQVVLVLVAEFLEDGRGGVNGRRTSRLSGEHLELVVDDVGDGLQQQTIYKKTMCSVLERERTRGAERRRREEEKGGS